MRIRIDQKIIPDKGQANFDSLRAFVGISVDNSIIYSPDAISGIFDWAFDNVSSFDVLIGDYLNRHNYQAFNGDNELSAIEKAEYAGIEARKRLAPLISQQTHHGIAQFISSTDLWSRQSFATRRAHFETCYSKRDDFRKIVDEGVDKFLSRRHPLSLYDAEVRAHCTAYQLEELAMFEQLAMDGYDLFIYPGAHLSIMKSLVSKEIDGISDDIARLVLVELRIFRDEI